MVIKLVVVVLLIALVDDGPIEEGRLGRPKEQLGARHVARPRDVMEQRVPVVRPHRAEVDGARAALHLAPGGPCGCNGRLSWWHSHSLPALTVASVGSGPLPTLRRSR